MYRVLIICPSAGEESDTPCGADIYVLAKYLTEHYDVTVEVLTSRKDIEINEKLKCAYIETYKDKWKDAVTEYKNSGNIVVKIINRFKVAYYSREVEKHNIARYVMSFKELKDWIAGTDNMEYDLLISVSHPFYVHQYAKYIFENLTIKKWCSYFLDPYADNSETRPNEIEKRVVEEDEIFRECTNLFVVKEFVSKAVNSKIRDYTEKIIYVPTHPIVDKTGSGNTNKFKRSEVHCVFTGMFYDTIRNPRELFEIFKLLPSNYYLHLYYKGCSNIVEEYRSVLGGRLITNGYITDKTEFDNMIRSMDILLNVGNAISNQVPSKILNYFSYGKPVLNFKNCEDDPIEKNYSVFPLLKTVPYLASQKTAEEIIKFYKMHGNNKLGWPDIKCYFEDSTLEYLGQQLYFLLENENCN